MAREKHFEEFEVETEVQDLHNSLYDQFLRGLFKTAAY